MVGIWRLEKHWWISWLVMVVFLKGVLVSPLGYQKNTNQKSVRWHVSCDKSFSKVGESLADKLGKNQLINPMFNKLSKNRGGFTLVEIMIVVAIIALLAAIAVPNFLRARKRSQASRVLEDLRMIDSATDQYAIENNLTTGTTVTWAQIQSYLKTGTVLYTSGGNDLFGNSYGTFTVDTVPKVNTTTFNALSDVAPASFWSPFH